MSRVADWIEDNLDDPDSDPSSCADVEDSWCEKRFEKILKKCPCALKETCSSGSCDDDSKSAKWCQKKIDKVTKKCSCDVCAV